MSTDPQERRGPGRAAPWFLLLALVFVAVAVLSTLLRSKSTPGSTPPMASDPRQPIDAFAGEASAPERGRIVAQLAPLHPDEEHQRFDGQSLRARLGLGEGEPLRLRLLWDAGPANGGDPDSAGAHGERRAEVALGFESLEVRDARGLAAATFELGERSDAPVDPVRALAAVPTGGLAPGQAVDVLLWGRLPQSPAELRGLAGVEKIELFASTLARAELERAFTHLTRGDEVVRSGKSAALGASEASGGTRAKSDE